MNAKNRVAVLSILLGTALSSIAFADNYSSPYSFGGSCGSQGAWTQAALSSTQNLRNVTQQLRDDPNCKALSNAVHNAILNIQNEVETIKKESADTNSKREIRLAQITKEKEALNTMANTASPEEKKQILRLIMDRNIEGATLSAQVGTDRASMLVNPSKLSSWQLDFGGRLRDSTSTSLNLLNQVIDSIPKLNECVTDDNQILGALLSSSAQVAAAFASSAQDTTGSQLALTVSKIANIVRDVKYSKILRKLNQQEFLSSMSCLIEVTSESYCAARDSMILFRNGMAQLKMQQSPRKDLSAKNPFAGYYVLNVHVPNITRWLQKIQIGVDPKLPTDATFQNRILQEVTDFYKDSKTLLGDYNSSLETIKSMPTLQARQNAVLKLITQTSNSILGSGFERKENVNFFTMGKTAVTIPFFLVGMDQVPEQVLGTATGTAIRLSYDDWFQMALAKKNPLFNDPIALAETVGRNMQELIAEANYAAIQYFNKWYIVDKQALVNESLTDINFTVKDSLKATLDYLSVFRSHLTQYGTDLSTLPTVDDSSARIKKILAAYDELDKMGRKFAKVNSITSEELNASAKAYENLITTVYEQFLVQQARSGFIANRLVNYVYQDYILLIKNRVGFGQFEEELFMAQGMLGLDKMLQIYNGNPAHIESDLNMALSINKGNIEALEMLLKDHVVGSLAELKTLSEGGDTSERGVRKNSVIRSIKDTWEADKAGGYMTSTTILSLLPRAVLNVYSNTNRYPLTSRQSSVQTEFSDGAYLHAQLCIQSLAFANQGGIYPLCEKAILRSPLSLSASNGLTKLDMSYTTKLYQHFNERGLDANKQKAKNHSARICAFRDYNRATMVQYMKNGMNKNAN